MHKSVDFDRLEKLSRREGPYAFHREGKIRELANLTDLRDVSLEKDHLRTLDEASPRARGRVEKLSMSRGGYRFYSGKN